MKNEFETPMAFIGQFNYKYDLVQIFEDCLNATLNFFSLPDKPSIPLETFKRYSEKDRLIIGKFPFFLIHHYDKLLKCNEWVDPLGDLYMELSSSTKSKRLGQFFTPESVCTMTAMITMGEKREEGKIKTINDPACGSGRMLLAANSLDYGNHFFAEDLDAICCKMTAINCLFHGMRTEIVQHNSLDPVTFYAGWIVNYPIAQHLPNIQPITATESEIVKRALFKSVQLITEPVKLPSEERNSEIQLTSTQLSLF